MSFYDSRRERQEHLSVRLHWVTMGASIFTSDIRLSVFFKQVSQSSLRTVFWVVPQGGLRTRRLWGLLGCCWGGWAAPALQLLVGFSAEDQERAGSPWPAGWIKRPCESLTTVGFTPQPHTACCCRYVPYTSITCKDGGDTPVVSYMQMLKMRFLNRRERYNYTYAKKIVPGPALWVGIGSIPHLSGRTLLLSDCIILHDIFCYWSAV